MRIVLGITGASGVQYGTAVVDLLAETDVETHLIASRHSRRVFSAETDVTVESLTERVAAVHHPGDIGATVASGSFEFDGMLVCPCSMKSLGYIANGIAEGLIPRVADVCLKEDRKLVLVPRESPMAHTHLENMVKASKAGARIAPAAPGFYTEPASLDEFVHTFAARLLDEFDIETDAMARWNGD